VLPPGQKFFEIPRDEMSVAGKQNLKTGVITGHSTLSRGDGQRLER
jgi:hypothetical protein